MNDIYQALSATRNLPEMCEVFQLPDLAEIARHLPSSIPPPQRKRTRPAAAETEEIDEEVRGPLRPDHRFVSSLTPFLTPFPVDFPLTSKDRCFLFRE
jgi:hypothetical protein